MMTRGWMGAGLGAVVALALLAGPVSAKIDNGTRIDVNSIGCFVTNHDSYAYDLTTGNSGLEWPRGSGKTAVFAAGLWVGAKINDQTAPTVKVGEYSQQWGPGPIQNGTGAPDSAQWRVYKIFKDASGNLAGDVATWPAAYGAPVDETGAPKLLGDMTLWSVCNDRSALTSSNRAGTDGTGPGNSLGLEIQQTTFGFSRKGPLNNVIFLKFRFVNKGGNTLKDTYVSLWADPDLGDASDDFVGCDTTLSLGYIYNANNNDGVYGVGPPVVGWDFFQGPRDNRTGRRLGMTSFNKYINGTDPQSAAASYNYMKGLNADGTDYKNQDGVATKFVNAGDPVAGTGDLDTEPADRRLMMSAGPFDMAPGDTQEVVAGVIVGRGGDNKSSITVTRLLDVDAQLAFDQNFDLANPPKAPIVAVRMLANAIDLSWDAASTTDRQHKEFTDPSTGEPVVRDYYFEGYNIYQAPTPSGPWKKLATFDLKDSIQFVYGEQFNSDANGLQREVLQSGRNSGLRFHYSTASDALTGGRIINNKPYFFSVTAYNYEADAAVPYIDEKIKKLQGHITETVENDPGGQRVTVVPASDTRIFTITPKHTAGVAEASLNVDVFQPDSATGHDYELSFFYTYTLDGADVVDSALAWRLTDVTAGKVVRDSVTDFSGVLPDGEPFSNLVVRLSQPPSLVKSARYIPGGDNPFEDGGFGGGYLGGAMDLAETFFGTALGHGQLVPIELRFDPSAGQKAFAYTRCGGFAGCDPNYGFLGAGTVPFTAWDMSGATPRQINVAFVQNRPDTTWSDPARWLPSTASNGGREYMSPLLSSYQDGNPDQEYAPGHKYRDALFNAGDMDALYTFWYRRGDDAIGPQKGDVIRIQLNKLLTPTDRYRFTWTAVGGAPGDVVNNDMSRIRVVPNPYYAHSSYETTQFQRRIKFTHLPNRKLTIRIFNLAGDLVRTLRRDNINQAETEWDLLNESRLPVASGVYIYHVEADGLSTVSGRLAVFVEREKLNFY